MTEIQQTLEILRQLFWVIFTIVIIRSSFIEAYRIPSPSMVPTLMNGDHIFVNKMAYGLKFPWPISEGIFKKKVFLYQNHGPKSGDTIVFDYPNDPSVTFIKRVIAGPGDTIEVKDDTVYVNDKPYERMLLLDRKILKTVGKVGMGFNYDPDRSDLFEEQILDRRHFVLLQKNFSGKDFFEKKTIPPGKYFVMGDNRDVSDDSRSWGFVPQENIKGRAIFIWLSWMPAFKNSWNPKNWDSDFRFERIGKKVD